MTNPTHDTSNSINEPRPHRHRGRRTAWPLLPILALCASSALAQSDSAEVAVGPSGLAVESADGRYAVGLRGYFQLGGRYFASPEEGVTDELLLRRIRPILTMRGDDVSLRVMPDLASGFALLDAYLEYAPFEAFAIRLGLTKTPFGLELLQSPPATLFLERSPATGLVPNRDVGLLFHGSVDDGLFEYAVGLFNGVADGENGGRDLDDGKDIVVRAFVRPFAGAGVDALAGLGLGVALTWGEQTGDEANPLLPRYRTAGRASWFSYAAGDDPGTTTYADGTRLRLTGQLYYHFVGFELIGEYVHVRQRRCPRRGARRPGTQRIPRRCGVHDWGRGRFRWRPSRGVGLLCRRTRRAPDRGARLGHHPRRGLDPGLR